MKGSDVKESSLATVRNAAALGGFKATNVRATLHDGETSVLFRQAPFTIAIGCELNRDPDGPAGPLTPTDLARMELTTSADNSAYDAGDSLGDFDITDNPQPFDNLLRPTGQSQIRAADHGVAIAQNGTMIIESGVYSALNSLGGDGTCSFGGQFLAKKAGGKR